MTFHDNIEDKYYSLNDIAKEYRTFQAEDPDNNEETLCKYLFNVIDACLRGRNDLDIIATRKQVNSMRAKLLRMIKEGR
jgi:hypothetical protein